MRLSIIVFLEQVHYVTHSYLLLLVVAVKVFIVFRLEGSKISLVNVVIAMISFPALSYVVGMLPFAKWLHWGTTLTYCMLGLPEKYLSLQLMVNGKSLLTN